MPRDIPTDAEMIFWGVALIVTVVGLIAFLVIGDKVWGDGR